jgi:hypothetical protein
MPVQFWYRGPALLDKEVVEIVDWNRPYGIPYATLKDGREVHRDQLKEIEEKKK